MGIVIVDDTLVAHVDADEDAETRQKHSMFRGRGRAIAAPAEGRLFVHDDSMTSTTDITIASIAIIDIGAVHKCAVADATLVEAIFMVAIVDIVDNIGRQATAFDRDADCLGADNV